MDFDIFALTHTGGGHVLTVCQPQKDVNPRLVVIAGQPYLSLPAEAMMERLMGESLDGAPAAAAPAT